MVNLKLIIILDSGDESLDLPNERMAGATVMIRARSCYADYGYVSGWIALGLVGHRTNHLEIVCVRISGSRYNDSDRRV